MNRIIFASAALALIASVVQAQAQQGLATSSTIGGQNTIQQAPSGGTNRQAVGAGGTGAGDAVQPTAAEQREERRDNAVTDICKGC